MSREGIVTRTLSNEFKKERGIIDIQCDKDTSFMWCHVKYIRTNDSNNWGKPMNTSNDSILTDYDIILSRSLDYRGIVYPVKLDAITDIEKKNSIGFNVYTIGAEDVVLTLRVSSGYSECINLFMFKGKYMLIDDLSKFSGDYEEDKRRCRMCLLAFANNNRLMSHHCTGTGRGKFFPFILALSTTWFNTDKPRLSGYSYVLTSTNERLVRVSKVDSEDLMITLTISIMKDYQDLFDSYKKVPPEYTVCKYCGKGCYGPTAYFQGGYYHHLCFNECFPLIIVSNNAKELPKIDDTKCIEIANFMLFPDRIETNKLLLTKNLLTVYQDQGVDPDTIISLVVKRCYPCIDSVTGLTKNGFLDFESFNLSIDDYSLARGVYESIGFTDFTKYVNLYTMTEASIISDTFGYLRREIYNLFRVDPCSHTTFSSLSWDIALHETSIFSDSKTLDTNISNQSILSILRNGSIDTPGNVIKRHSKANNKYMKDYDPNEADKYIIHFEVEKIYETQMTRLPMSNMKFEKQSIIDDINVNIYAGRDDKQYCSVSKYISKLKSDTGAIFIVDLKYPLHLHELHNDFPLVVTTGTLENTEEKIPMMTLLKKRMCVIYSENLDFYIKKGLLVVWVHSIITFQLKKTRMSFINRLPMVNLNMYPSTVPQIKLIVLELSRLLLQRFHYDFMVEKFGRDKILLVCSDYKSLIYEINHPDPYPIIYSDKDAESFPIDSSKYPLSSRYYSNIESQSRIFRDKCNGKIIREIVILDAKTYCYEATHDSPFNGSNAINMEIIDSSYREFKKAKGLTRNQFKEINIRHYKDALYRDNGPGLLSRKPIETRFLLPNSINTLAHGHYKTFKYIYDSSKKVESLTEEITNEMYTSGYNYDSVFIPVPK